MALFGTCEIDEYDASFSVKDSVARARIAGDIFQLVALDDVWTACARRNKPEELEDLGSIVNQMDSILNRLSEDTKVLLKVLQNVGEDRVEAMLSNPQFAKGDLVARLRDRAARDGGVLPMIQKGLQRASDNFSRERTQLRGEYERLRKGHKSDGDLEAMTQCGLGIMEMGLGYLPFWVDGIERVLTYCGPE